MKNMKRTILLISLIIILLSPVILYTGIVIANNSIANSIAKDLKSIKLPENTELVELVSIAGKIIGSGNGMQYFGALLVSSELSAEELEEYYQNYSEDIYVVKQETSEILDGELNRNYRFSNFDESKNNYIVHCWNHEHSAWEDHELISTLLDLDIRGH